MLFHPFRLQHYLFAGSENPITQSQPLKDFIPTSHAQMSHPLKQLNLQAEAAPLAQVRQCYCEITFVV
jgi:hypothetical protein